MFNQQWHWQDLQSNWTSKTGFHYVFMCLTQIINKNASLFLHVWKFSSAISVFSKIITCSFAHPLKCVHTVQMEACKLKPAWNGSYVCVCVPVCVCAWLWVWGQKGVESYTVEEKLSNSSAVADSKSIQPNTHGHKHTCMNTSKNAHAHKYPLVL